MSYKEKLFIANGFEKINGFYSAKVIYEYREYVVKVSFKKQNFLNFKLGEENENFELCYEYIKEFGFELLSNPTYRDLISDILDKPVSKEIAKILNKEGAL